MHPLWIINIVIIIALIWWLVSAISNTDPWGSAWD